MSIRLRLLLSYIAMIIIPVVFAIISATLVALLFRGDIKEIRNIYLPPDEHEAISKEEQLFVDLHRQTALHPDRFSDPSFLKETNSKLNQSHIRIAVRKGNKLIYVPSSLKNAQLENLPPFGVNREINPVERIDHQFVTIKRLIFSFQILRKVLYFLFKMQVI